MKRDNKIMFSKCFVLVGMILLFSGGVLAFAVSSTYYPGYPLQMLPGESEETTITLQNLAGEEDLSVKAEIISGSEILELTSPSDIYVVPAGGKTKVNVRITLPTNAKTGDSYPVEVRFTTIADEEEGTLSFGSSIGQKFDVIISGASPPAEETEKASLPWLTYLLIGAIIIVIIIIVIKRKRDNSIKP